MREGTIRPHRGSWGSQSHSPIQQLLRPRGNSETSTDKDNERTDRTDRETPHSTLQGVSALHSDFNFCYSDSWELVNEQNGITVHEMVSTYGVGTTVYAVSCNIQVRYCCSFSYSGPIFTLPVAFKHHRLTFRL